MKITDLMTTYDPIRTNHHRFLSSQLASFLPYADQKSHILFIIVQMRFSPCLCACARVTMAARVVQLLTVAVSLTSLLPPCSSRPLDQRHQRLETLLQKDVGGDNSSEILCHLCEVLTSYRLSSFYPTPAVLQAAVALIQEYLEEGASVDDMFPVLEPLCVVFLNQSFGYYGPYMCPGVIHSYGPVVSSVSHFVHVYSAKVSQCVTFNCNCSISLHSTSVCFYTESLSFVFILLSYTPRLFHIQSHSHSCSMC